MHTLVMHPCSLMFWLNIHCCQIAVMVTPCLWYVVGMKLVMSDVKFPQAPFARAPFGECQPPGPKCRKSLENVRGLRPEKVSKKRVDSPKTLSRHFLETLRRLLRLSPRLFGDFFGVPDRRLFGISGPEGPRDPCKGRTGSQMKCERISH